LHGPQQEAAVGGRRRLERRKGAGLLRGIVKSKRPHLFGKRIGRMRTRISRFGLRRCRGFIGGYVGRLLVRRNIAVACGGGNGSTRKISRRFFRTGDGLVRISGVSQRGPCTRFYGARLSIVGLHVSGKPPGRRSAARWREHHGGRQEQVE
jgi:hypothetical protein